MAQPNADDERVPVVSRVADALERLVFSGWYRRFVRALVVALAALAVVHAVRFATPDSALLSPAVSDALDVVTSALVAAFVLAGGVQLVVLARGLRRREGVVAESAEAVEESAEEVEAAARNLEAAIDEPEAIDEPAAVEDRVDRAQERADEARETAEEVAEELEPPDDVTESGTKDGDDNAS